MKDPNEEREKTRRRVAEHRARKKEAAGNTDVTKGNDKAEAEAEAKAKAESKKTTSSSSSRKDDGAFVEKVLEYWEEAALQPRAVSISKARRSAILARRKEHGEGAVWTALKNRVVSNFLNHVYNDGRGAPIDWVFGPKNFVKVVDGNYNEGPKGPRGKTDGTGTDYDATLNQ
jgi:uncharacterized membrane protein YqiK